MIADRVRMGKSVKYVLATDADFSGTINGEFVYIGSDEYVIIPHKIKGVTVTKTYNTSPFSTTGGMFGKDASIVKGVATLKGHSITDMGRMFYISQAPTLDLSRFDTSNVTYMDYMFESSQATTLDLSSFDTSNVTTMSSMFYDSQATTLDLLSFDTFNVTNMSNMFNRSQATTLDLSSFDTSNATGVNGMTNMFRNSQATLGYARTLSDANRFNQSSNKPAGLNFSVKI